MFLLFLNISSNSSLHSSNCRCGSQYFISFPSLYSEKDIDFGYRITIHKSQGSTYENVFINLDDIKKFSHVIGSEQMRKLLYVGVSRTKGICLILNNHG